MKPANLYRDQELAFRTQYAELKERTLAGGALLPGTPGSLALRSGTGSGYWYRVYYPVPGKPAEDFVCKDGDAAALAEMRERMAFSDWAGVQVAALRRLGFQVADKKTARVLVELHNRHAFDAGMILTGSLAYMSWLNELGAIAVAARTEDVDLARRQRLKLDAPLPFFSAMRATGLPFAAVPGLPSTKAPTSVKLTGAQGLRVDVLAPGNVLGETISIPELEWSAQTVPFYDYLLAAPEPGAVMAGGHCIPVKLPQGPRLVWHKLYASTRRRGFPEKAVKDQQQALVLGAILADVEFPALKRAFKDAPAAMTKPIRPLAKKLATRAQAHPALLDALRECLGD